MHTDVIRSLLLWPAAASTVITAVLWIPTQFSVNRAMPTVDLRLLARPLFASNRYLNDGEFVLDPIEAKERAEWGTRAMRLPPRVAQALGVPAAVLEAPFLDERQELAGLSLEPSENAPQSVRDLARGILDGDLTAADRIASGPGRTPAASQLLPNLGWQLQRRRGTSRVVPSDPHAASPHAGLAAGGPPGDAWTSERLEAETSEGDADSKLTDLNAPSVSPASVLPRSTRLLGRRELDAAASNDATMLPEQPELPSFDMPSFDMPRDDMPRDVSWFSHGAGEEASEDASGGDSSRPQPGNPDHVFPIVVDESDSAVKDGKASGSTRAIDLANPAGWPVTTELDEQLKTLTAMAVQGQTTTGDRFVSLSSSSERMTGWTQEVTARLEELRALPRLGDQRAGIAIEALGALADEGLRRAEQVDDRSHQVQWLQTSHAIARRVAIWRLVWEVTRGGNAWMAGDLPSQAVISPHQAVQAVRSDLNETGDIEGWSRYLLLDQLDGAGSELGDEERRILAQRFLSRLQWHRLSGEQQRWLQRESVSRLAEQIRPWTQNPVDYANLMQQIELQETDPLDLATIDVADTVQTLRYADNPLANQIAEAIDTHYRNANVRVAITATMLQRMVPNTEPRTVPVNSVILGRRVHGQSRVESDVAIELVPSADRWLLRLDTHGRAVTRSVGTQENVSVRTLGNSQFDSETPIEISVEGVSLGGTDAQVRGHSQLQGIQTQYDGWPIIEPLFRSLAENQYRAIAPQANRIANRTMEQRIESEIDQLVESKLDTANARLSDLVLGPLGRMQLDPRVTDMQTTQERLLARFRVAGDWQMAAFTPRPRAPSTSLMSIQVHQSAMNNALEQLVPRGEAMTIREMVQRVSRAFESDDVAVPDDLPDDVMIQFSHTRPITVEIDENRIWITMRVVRLRRVDSVDLTQFIVRAAYRPQVEGAKASLVRDGHLRISGPRMSMRERLPVRTIFNKVFSTNRELPITVARWQEHPAMEGLAVSQLELRSGWLAIAISEDDAPRIAVAP